MSKRMFNGRGMEVIESTSSDMNYLKELTYAFPISGQTFMRNLFLIAYAIAFAGIGALAIFFSAVW